MSEQRQPIVISTKPPVSTRSKMPRKTKVYTVEQALKNIEAKKEVTALVEKTIRQQKRKADKAELQAVAEYKGAGKQDNVTKVCAAFEMLIDAKIAGTRQAQLGQPIPVKVAERIKVARRAMAQALTALS
jgi:hypothetical protein